MFTGIYGIQKSSPFIRKYLNINANFCKFCLKDLCRACTVLPVSPVLSAAEVVSLLAASVAACVSSVVVAAVLLLLPPHAVRLSTKAPVKTSEINFVFFIFPPQFVTIFCDLVFNLLIISILFIVQTSQVFIDILYLKL